MPITQNPDSIVPALLSVLVMPNGEIICLGKTIRVEAVLKQTGEKYERVG